MDNYDIQKLLDFPDPMGIVKLPAGEFEGPFTVSWPCRIIGSNTTLWQKSGGVLFVNSRGVTVEDLQIEVTGASEEKTAVISQEGDTVFKNVCIFGETEGVAGDEGYWGLPKVISPGRICPDHLFEMYIEVEVPAAAEIICGISGVSVSPSVLKKGRSKVKFTVEPLSAGTIIYGDIEFRSVFIRRSYINLSADDVYNCESGETVYTAPAGKVHKPAVRYAVKNTPVPNTGSRFKNVQTDADNKIPPLNSRAAENSPNGQLIRGQRVSTDDVLGKGEITAELFYTSMDGNLDIDTYTFLLDEEGKAWGDECLVFFGNKTGGDGSVRYSDDGKHRIVHIDLAKLPPRIQNISIAYSIYGDDPRNNFSKLHGGMVVFRCGGKTAEFPMEGLFAETTVVAASLYKRGSIWKLYAVGQGYKNGLKPLCESYGLNIME